MRIILIYNPMRLFLPAVGDRKGIVSTAESALQQQVSSLYTDHHGWLPARARQALLLCKLDGLSYRDIAAELQVSVSSVEKYIAAGLLACYQAMHGQGA